MIIYFIYLVLCINILFCRGYGFFILLLYYFVNFLILELFNDMDKKMFWKFSIWLDFKNVFDIDKWLYIEKFNIFEIKYIYK